MFPTDGSTSSPQVQCSEERELVVTLATAESGFNAGDLTLSLLNSNGSAATTAVRPPHFPGCLERPRTHRRRRGLDRADRGQHELYDLNGKPGQTASTPCRSTTRARARKSILPPLRVAGRPTAFVRSGHHLLRKCRRRQHGAPGYQPDLDDTGSGSINNTDARRYSAADALAFTTSAAAYPTTD